MELRDSRVYYGICSTDEDQTTKDVVIMNPILVDNNLDLAIGDELIVKFEKGNINPEPTLNLNISDNNNNVTVSANSGYRVLIDEICDWGAQTIVSFVYVYGAPVAAVVTEEEVNSEIVRTVTEIGAESMYWKPIDYKVASEDIYGVTKLVTDVNKLEDENNRPDNRPVSYNIIKGLFNNLNSSLGLKYDSSNGNLSLVNDETGDTTISLPVPPNRTSQLTNDGEGNERFWSSNKNNCVDSQGLGIGFKYISNNETKIMKSFQPRTDFTPTGENVPRNMIRIGYDALKAYQNGEQIEANGVSLSSVPYVRVYGSRIDFSMDNTDGVVGIGAANYSDVDGEKQPYSRLYYFNNSGATFKKPLNANDGVIADSITYKNKELEDRLPYYYIKRYSTAAFTLKATSAYTSTSTDDNRTLTISPSSIPDGYTPIAIVGYNINGGGGVHFINMWECYLNKTVIHYGVYNFSSQEQALTGIDFYILFVKTDLIKKID